MEWNTERMKWGNGTAAWNRSLEQMHGTDLEPKCVPIMHMEYFVWNSCMEVKSGTAACNRSLEQMHGTELVRKTLSGTAVWNGSLEQMHGTVLEPKYFCLE